MPPISLKALIVSNVCYWLFLVLGMIILIVAYYAGLTIASDGASDSHAIFEQMRASSTLLLFIAFISIIAASLAGYIGARMAPDAKLLNGALAISLWFLLTIYIGVKGGGGESKIHGHVPFVLGFLTSYGIVIPALAGAYLGNLRGSDSQLRAQIRAANQTEMLRPYEATPARVAGAVSTQAKRRLAYGGSGLGTFIFIASQFLLNQHEQNMLLIGLLVVMALIVATALIIKKLTSTRSG